MTNAPLKSCPACGCRDLFVRKDFPQKVGLSVVVAAAVAFLVLAARGSTFYLGVWILVAATGVDAVLYLIVPRVTVCYRCRAEFRNLPHNPDHTGFELAVAEKYRSTAHVETRPPSPGTPGEGGGEGPNRPRATAPHPNPLPEYRARERRGT